MNMNLRKRAVEEAEPVNELSTNPLKKLCRLCLLPQTNMEPIFPFHGEVTTATKIFECTSLQMKTDNEAIPTSICDLCKKTIEKYHQFREACIKNDEILRNLASLMNPDQKATPKTEVIENKEEDNTTETKVLQIKRDATEEEERETDGDGAAGTSYPEHKIPVVAEIQNGACFPDSSNEQMSKIDKRKKQWRHLNKSAGKMHRRLKKKRMVKNTGELKNCEICGKSVINMWLHSLQHKDRQWACTFCNMTFYQKAVWEQHVLSHERNRQKNRVHNCTVCNREFIQISRLRSHLSSAEHLANMKASQMYHAGRTVPVDKTRIDHDYDIGSAIMDKFIMPNNIKAEPFFDENGVV